ncbi:MAG: hypothetical protein MN733_26215 [Nitrososphaera sp.]|nr:hypothetical protein [Nitrososphaera sp.]
MAKQKQRTGMSYEDKRREEFLERVRKMTPTQLGRLPHAELLAMRSSLKDQGASTRQMLAGLEHGAFAREWVEENPLLAVPSLLFATPGYAIGKKVAQATGLDRYIPYLGGTPPTISQVASGYEGMWSGIRNKLSSLVSGQRRIR